jgi:rare lipoprotein A
VTRPEPSGVPPSRFLPLISIFVIGLLQVGCSAHRFEQNRPGATQRGIASWYGEEFHGRPTASGKIYDMHALTAAHRELPLGTVLAVRNLDNGKSVRVTVTDRGPFKRGRVLDLSFAAAKELAMVNRGTAPVEIEILEAGSGPSGPNSATRFTVQVGAFKQLENAEAMIARLVALRDDVKMVEDGPWHRVQVGLFRRLIEAEELRSKLLAQGFQAVVIYLN